MSSRRRQCALRGRPKRCCEGALRSGSLGDAGAPGWEGISVTTAAVQVLAAAIGIISLQADTSALEAGSSLEPPQEYKRGLQPRWCRNPRRYLYTSSGTYKLSKKRCTASLHLCIPCVSYVPSKIKKIGTLKLSCQSTHLILKMHLQRTPKPLRRNRKCTRAHYVQWTACIAEELLIGYVGCQPHITPQTSAGTGFVSAPGWHGVGRAVCL